MSNDMKIILESFRKNVVKEKIDLPDPETFTIGANPETGEVYGRMPVDSPKKQEKPATFEDISVSEFMEFYSDVKVKVEFYDKMDEQIDSLLESHLPNLIKTEEQREQAVKLIGKAIRAYVGQLSGLMVSKGINSLIKSIIEAIGIVLDIGEQKMYVMQKFYEPIGKHIVVPLIGQYIAEYTEKKIVDIMGKFDPDELGNVKNDAGKTFSVSPIVKNLISKMSDDTEEKLSSLHLQKLSRQLKLIGRLISDNRPRFEFDEKTGEVKGFEDSVEFLETPLVKLKGYKDEIGLSGDELALKLVASEIGAKKVTVSESKRRRIVYRGKK